MKTTLYATVTNGTFSNRKNFDELIQQWEGKRIAITVEKAKTKQPAKPLLSWSSNSDS